tara:strand:+ start:426 stop:617 length:192 start_codon:yes stop_codon:yes gene_type:complete
MCVYLIDWLTDLLRHYAAEGANRAIIFILEAQNFFWKEEKYTGSAVLSGYDTARELLSAFRNL